MVRSERCFSGLLKPERHSSNLRLTSPTAKQLRARFPKREGPGKPCSDVFLSDGIPVRPRHTFQPLKSKNVPAPGAAHAVARAHAFQFGRAQETRRAHTRCFWVFSPTKRQKKSFPSEGVIGRRGQKPEWREKPRRSFTALFISSVGLQGSD